MIRKILNRIFIKLRIKDSKISFKNKIVYSYIYGIDDKK